MAEVKTIYKDNFLMIKTAKNQTFLYFKDKNGDYIKSELFNKEITPTQAKQFAPALTVLINRVYFIAHLDGFKEGKKAGKTETQNEIKKILNI